MTARRTRWIVAAVAVALLVEVAIDAWAAREGGRVVLAARQMVVQELSDPGSGQATRGGAAPEQGPSLEGPAEALPVPRPPVDREAEAARTTAGTDAVAPAATTGSRRPRLREAAPIAVLAQGAPQPPDAPPVPALPAATADGDDRPVARPAVRVGSDYALAAGERVREAVVVGGSAAVDGEVTGDLVVVMGSARLSSTARVGGDLVIVGGSVTIAPGVVVDRDLVVVGGALEAPPDFEPGGEQVIIGHAAVGEALRDVGPWVSRGLFWGRPIVPGLPWVWGVAFVAAFFYLLVAFAAPTPVLASASHLGARPLSAALAGLLVLVLLGPAMVLLAISVVGIIVIPFLLCAVIAAGLVGKVAVLRAIGASVLPAGDPESRGGLVRAVAVGLVILTVFYMIPVVGLVAWGLVGVVGLGAGAMAAAAALRREHHAPRVPPPPPPPLAGSAPSGAAYSAAAIDPLPGAASVYASGVVPDDGVSPPSPGAAGTPAEASASVPSTPPPVVPPLPATDPVLLPRATFWQRLGAFLLDVILVAFTAGLLDIRTHGPGGRFFLLLLAYRIGFWIWKGTTVGGMIVHLRVLRADGAPLTAADAVVRGLSSIFSFAVLGLGCLWVLWDRERQAWHDKIAGTYVVVATRP